MDKSLSFEERLKMKSRSGFDLKVSHKNEITQRFELKRNLESVGKASKKHPKQKYSKMPVSVVRPLGGTDQRGPSFRDPRFGKQKSMD